MSIFGISEHRLGSELWAMKEKVSDPCPPSPKPWVKFPLLEQGRNPNSQLSSAIFAIILPTEPEDHDQTICRVPVNGLIVILRFYG